MHTGYLLVKISFTYNVCGPVASAGFVVLTRLSFAPHGYGHLLKIGRMPINLSELLLETAML